MIKKRGGGVLLHLTSLPSEFGIGDLGPGAYRFVDFLAKSKQGYWQILPLNQPPADSGNSPYSALSAFAGNTWVISPHRLYEQGLLSREDLQDRPSFPDDRVDYRSVVEYKMKILRKAWDRFRSRPESDGFAAFCRAEAEWLDDYALFVVLRDHFRPRPWWDWPTDLRDRREEALQAVRREFQDSTRREQFLQFVFQQQWLSLKDYANRRRIQIIGDISLYVGYDSADVWTHPDLFKLTKDKKLREVAGFPPDHFCKTGQRWGNPVYEWDALKKTDYHWWIRRILYNLNLYDALRIDHFRGLITYWAIPASHPTAEHGKWMSGPKDGLFNELFKHLAFPPIIVEVLGDLTPEVREYTGQLHLPEMRVVMYAFETDDATDPHYPHNHVRNAVAYTGTHDTNTVRGWFDKEATREQKRRLFTYVGQELAAQDVPWAVIRLTLQSVCNWAIVPMQDVLGLGEESRMNRPGQAKGQWRWRVRDADLRPELAEKLAQMAKICARA